MLDALAAGLKDLTNWMVRYSTTGKPKGRSVYIARVIGYAKHELASMNETIGKFWNLPIRHKDRFSTVRCIPSARLECGVVVPSPLNRQPLISVVDEVYISRVIDV